MKLTWKNAKAMGIEVPPKVKPPGKRKAAKQQAQDQKVFDSLCKAHGLPVPVHEYPFAEEIDRKWRFDYLFDGWLAVEKVGGIWKQGHHSGGQSQADDMERRNSAVLLGYSVLEFTPQQFEDGSAFQFIKRVLDAGMP